MAAGPLANPVSPAIEQAPQEGRIVGIGARPRAHSNLLTTDRTTGGGHVYSHRGHAHDHYSRRPRDDPAETEKASWPFCPHSFLARFGNRRQLADRRPEAARFAGAASLVSWAVAAFMLVFIALVYAELAATYPVSGGTARYSFLCFGPLAGFAAGWTSWLQAVTIGPIETEIAINYLEPQWSGLVTISGQLTEKGVGVAIAFMVFFTVVNLAGIRFMAGLNHLAVYWKIAVPLITVGALAATSFHTSNFSAGGGFAPFRGGGRPEGHPSGRVGVGPDRFRAGRPGRRRGTRAQGTPPDRRDRLTPYRRPGVPAAAGGVHRGVGAAEPHQPVQLAQPPGWARWGLRPVRRSWLPPWASAGWPR